MREAGLARALEMGDRSFRLGDLCRYAVLEMSNDNRDYESLFGPPIGETEFCRKYGVNTPECLAELDRRLAEAISNEDADSLEVVLALDSQLDTPNRTSVFETLLDQTWHFSHEYMIRYLQDHASATSVEPLRRAVELKPQLEYLEYDDYGAYYKKCFWALAVNPDPRAIDVIREFANSGDEVLREQARYRLNKIQPGADNAG